MKFLPQENVTSASSLASTIKVDAQTRRWFLLLLSRPEAASFFLKNPEEKRIYLSLRRALAAQKIFLLIVLGLTALTLYTKATALIIMIFPALFLHYRYGQRTKLYLAHLGTCLVLNELGDSFKNSTLYQITSTLSDKYNIPSLVDTQYTFDNALRHIVMLLFLILIVFPPSAPLTIPTVLLAFIFLAYVGML